jgi:hypothetical protein
VAGKQRPSFLKRQKEQKRLARAAQKREARQARKQARDTDVESPADSDPFLEGPDEAEAGEASEG